MYMYILFASELNKHRKRPLQRISSDTDSENSQPFRKKAKPLQYSESQECTTPPLNSTPAAAAAPMSYADKIKALQAEFPDVKTHVSCIRKCRTQDVDMICLTMVAQCPMRNC